MRHFEEIAGYQTPIVSKVNEHVAIGIYYPEKKNPRRKSIINIYNSKTNSSMQLYSNTLLNISNIFINSILLNTLPKIKNKKVSKKNRK